MWLVLTICDCISIMQQSGPSDNSEETGDVPSHKLVDMLSQVHVCACMWVGV